MRYAITISDYEHSMHLGWLHKLQPNCFPLLPNCPLTLVTFQNLDDMNSNFEHYSFSYGDIPYVF